MNEREESTYFLRKFNIEDVLKIKENDGFSWQPNALNLA